MEIIKCNDLAEDIKHKAKEIVHLNNLKPHVIILQVGDNKASNTYVKRKIETMNECGVEAEVIRLSDCTTTYKLQEIIKILNECETTTGIIVQLPLPKHINVFEVLETISPIKDIDCLTSKNLGLLAKGKSYIEPATPRGVIRLLDSKLGTLDGLSVLMIGRSEIVGLPLSLMLTQKNCTVTLAHSYSEYNVNDYDIVISAIGRGESIVVNNPNTICIDVGINYKQVDGKMKQIGDFDIENESFDCKWVSSPKGGTGILTSATVCLNAVELTMKQKEII